MSEVYHATHWYVYLLKQIYSCPKFLPPKTIISYLCRIPKYYHGDITLIVVNTYHSALQLILLKDLDMKVKDTYFFTPLDYDLKSK